MNQAQSLERSALLREVLHGRMSPVEAEAKAIANGLDPFEQCADLEKCDPMSTRDWSLAMAVSWIVWRDLTTVRQAWDKYRSQRVFWAPLYRRDGTDATWDIVGHYLERLPTASVQSVSLAAMHSTREPWLVEDGKAYTGPGQMGVYDALGRLWEKLGEGALKGYASKVGEETRRGKIERFDWGLLETHADPYDADALYAKGKVRSAPLYRHVLLERDEKDDILPLWSQSSHRGVVDPTESLTQPQKRARRVAALRLAIEHHIRLSPKVISLTKSQISQLDEAADLSARARDEALSAARLNVPNNEWAVGGRPKGPAKE